MPNTIEATITQKVGIVYVEREGERLSLDIGDAIYEQDLILTGPNTVAEIQYRDGTKSRLAPETEMKLVDFEYGLSADSENSFLVDIAHGAMRTVTGEVVKLNPQGFIISTEGVEMSVTGTEVLNSVINGKQFHAFLYSTNLHSVSFKVDNVPNIIQLDQLRQALSLDTNSDQFTIKTYSAAELINIIKSFAPSLAFTLPNSKATEGSWEDFLKAVQQQEEEKNSENNQEQDPDNIVLNVSQGTLTGEEITQLLQAGVDEINVVDTTVEGFTLEGEEGITPALEDLVNSLVFDTDDKTDDVNNNSQPNITITNFDTFTSGILNLGDGLDKVTVTSMTGGTINLGGGNDSIFVSALGFGADIVNPFTRSVPPEINGGAGDDFISLGAVTEGTVSGGEGNDSIHIINLGDPSLTAPNITIFSQEGSDTIHIDNFYSGNILANNATTTVYVGNMQNGSINLGSNDILANNTVTIGAMADGTLITGAGNDLVNIDSTIFGSIDLSDGDDTINIGILNKNVAGPSAATGINLGEGNNYLYIDSVEYGSSSGGSSIFAGSGNDTVTFNNYGEVYEIDLGAGNDILAILNTAGEGFINSGSQQGVDMGAGTDILITADASINSSLPYNLEILVKVTGNTVEDLDIKKYNIVVNNDGSVVLGQGWTQTADAYEHISGASLETMNGFNDITIDPSVVTTRTISMTDTSNQIPLADIPQGDPVQDSYSSTLNHYSNNSIP